MVVQNVFEGRTALVIGGGSGIGKAITAALLERGSNVVVLEISPENAQTAADELTGGGRLTFVEGSVSKRADVEEAFRIAGERYGTVHHLVNNAGTASLSLIRDFAAQRITGHFIPVDGGQHVRGLHSYWDVAKAQGLVARPE